MVKTYTIEWFYLHQIAGKSQWYKLHIGLHQGKRVFQYLVRLKDALCVDALCSCVPMERNDQLTVIVRAIFKEHHLSCPAIKVSCSCIYRHNLKQQRYVTKRFVNNYIAMINTTRTT